MIILAIIVGYLIVGVLAGAVAARIYYQHEARKRDLEHDLEIALQTRYVYEQAAARKRLMEAKNQAVVTGCIVTFTWPLAALTLGVMMASVWFWRSMLKLAALVFVPGRALEVDAALAERDAG